MNLARLLRMSPAEVTTRAQQAFSKRWSKPPACRLIPSDAAPCFPRLSPLDSLASAEQICRHRFDLLGYTDLDFGSPVDWHLDPVHQKRAPRQPWYQIPFLDFDQVGDHKIIWELNRHQHLVTLARAGFHDEIVAQWTGWQSENPYPIGINWASTLEVAFRALSWLWVRNIIGDFHPDLIPALHLHGWYIEHFLSTYFSPNTHLLGEGVALFAIGLMCPQIADARRWQKHGWQIVLEQAETQVRPDGFHFEQSVYYHVYARDFFEFARSLAAMNGIAIPPLFARTIDKMNQTGPLPNFGDDDGGRVIGGGRALARAPFQPGPVGGIYAMPSPNAQLFIRASSPPPFAAGHTHADSLSIQLIVDGRPVLIDPGTYCYVCPERDRFRGTAAHNTLQVDGRDQARPNGPFAWTNLPETTVDRWHINGSCDFFAGHHDGYRPVIHYRWVFGLKSKFWLVRDLATGPLSHQLDIHWHFLDKDLTILPPSGHTWTQSLKRWDWSPAYGRKEPASVLRFSTHTALPAEFAVLLISGEPGTFTQTAPAAYRYKEPQGSQHEFLFGDRFVYRAISPAGISEFTL
ncbi:MAG TPA: alginate lyase family protein [Bryobacteraceae bacterium]|jgi:hypothetical protein|nr:alginate lyase family protein [Bryobacteraceae bacterium]